MFCCKTKYKLKLILLTKPNDTGSLAYNKFVTAVNSYVSVFMKCRKQFHPSRNSANAYIVFTTELAAEQALSLYVVTVYMVNN